MNLGFLTLVVFGGLDQLLAAWNADSSVTAWLTNRTALANLAGFGLFIVGTYLLVRLVQIRSSGCLLFAVLSLVVASFVVLKHYAFLEGLVPQTLWGHTIELVGISYMLFKFIHVLVDAWQGQLAGFDFLTYANYQLAFFTLVAGPIQRYNDFHRFWTGPGQTPADTRDTWRAWNRILTGLAKIGPLAAVLWYVFGQAGERFDPLRTQYPVGWLLVYMYTYPVYLYFNFSGYTDIVIGAARLLGCELPENFARPYLARNILDFWNRWHITLTHWIRDYVFMTSYKRAAEVFPGLSKYLGWGLMFLALFIAGVWHGSTGGFAVFGALNGLGAAVNQAYADFLKKWLGKAGLQAYLRNPLIHVLAVALTLSYEAFCFLFFSSGVQRALHLIHVAATEDGWLVIHNPAVRGLAVKAVCLGLPLLAALAGLVYWQGPRLVSGMQRLRERGLALADYLYIYVLGKTVLVTAALLLCWAITESDPVVVYMRF